MCKGIIGYEAHQVSVLAIMVTKKYEYEHKKHSFQFHIFQRLTLGNLKFALIMNHPLVLFVFGIQSIFKKQIIRYSVFGIR